MPAPNLVIGVATTDATVTDNAMTAVIDDDLAVKGLAPARPGARGGAVRVHGPPRPGPGL